MAFTTGPDFLSGILGASNSTDVLNKFKSDTGQEDFYQGLRNRYGERIGEDGYLDGGVGTYDFIDSDRDGIDDRHQAGPGQPKAGSNPDGNPIFGGGDGNPPPLGGNNADARQAARDAAMQDSYDMNPDGTISQYDASTGETTTYNYNDEGLSFPQQFFGTAMTVADMVPKTTDYVGGIVNALDQALANALGFTPEEGEYDNSAAAAALGLLGPTSYETNQAAATENSLANIAYKDEVNALAEVDPALRKRLTSFGEDLSISDYNTALSEFTPTENFPSLTTSNHLAAYQQAQKESQAEKDFQRQQNINNAVASGDFIGTGYNSETGNYGGLLTNTNSNSGTSVTSNVQTGPYSGAALSGAIQNENFNNMMANQRQAREARNSDGNSSGAGGNATGGNARESNAGDSGCFEPNTLIEMQDGSEKKIKEVQLGDITKGGKVTGVLQFEPIDDIHEYKGVVVAGSHFVKEGNEFIMVQDSPESVKIDKIPVVYSLDTTNRRIFINNIEFADYNGDGIAKKFLNNAGMDLSGFDKEVLRQVEHRLI